MGTTTPIRGLYKPAKAEINWDAQINANFDNLDTTADKSYVDTQDATTLAGAKSYTDTQIATGVNWNELQGATGNVTVANGAFNSTFNQTSAAATWTWANTTAATLGVGNNSPTLQFNGTYFGAPGGVLAASNPDGWSIQNTVVTAAPTISGTAQITNISESAGSVVTLTLASAAQVPLPGQVWEISGMGAGNGDWLNGYAVKLITATSITCTFNDPTSHGTYASHATTGAPLMTKVSGLGQLIISHNGSPVETQSSNTTTATVGGWGNAVLFQNTNNVVIGNPNTAPSPAAGAISLFGFNSPNAVQLLATGGNGFALSQVNASGAAVGGACFISCGAGFNLQGSGSSQLGLASNITCQGIGTSNTFTLNASTVVAATAGQSQSAALALNGTYWNGSVSAGDTWTITNSIANGTNGASILNITHAGTAGGIKIQAPAVVGIYGWAGGSGGIGPGGSGNTNQVGIVVGGAELVRITGSSITAGLGIDLGATVLGGTGKFSVNTSGVATQYNGEATAGVGTAYIRGNTSQKAETGADANVLTLTPAAVAGLYRIVIALAVSAASAATLGWTATWTDSNGIAQAPANLALTKAGVAAPALTFAAAANDAYYAEAIVDINNAGTAIVIKTTFAGTSIAYKASATIERLA